MPIDMAVFDLAGTTVWDGDNAVASRLCEAIHAVDKSVTIEDVNPVTGMYKPDAIRALLGGSPDNRLIHDIYEDFKRRMVDHYRTQPHIREIPGAGDLFRELRKRGVAVTVDTGFDAGTLGAILDRLQWHELVDHAISSDDVEQGRPHPEMIHALMHRAGVTEPARVVKVGDSLSDIEQGINARCGVVIAVLNQRTTPLVDRYPQVHFVAELAEVVPILETSGLRPVESGQSC